MKREEMIALLEERGSSPWDIVVVGGGATGLGAALDASLRGCRVLLLEQSDFAKGTSSRSTKLIHGGVRYLRQGNVSLVQDSLRERDLLMRNAPGLVHSLSFIVPSYRWWDSAYYGIGLKVYDCLAGELSLSRSRHLDRDEVLTRSPGIGEGGLRGGTLYYDAQFDDARLAIGIAKTAASNGAVLINYMPVEELLKRQDGAVAGVSCRDIETGKEYEVEARVVVNATGPFADGLRRMDSAEIPGMVTPSRGAHVMLERKFFPGDSALMIPKTDDGRLLFVIPWHNRVIVGTTDTSTNEFPLEPTASEEEIEFLIEHAGRYLKDPPRLSDVRSVFAGLRPLASVTHSGSNGGVTSKVSRDHLIQTSTSGLVTIAGGKWTTYRKMAEDVIDVAIRQGRVEAGESRSGEQRLESDSSPREEHGDRIHPELPYSGGDLDAAVESEMARRLEDVLSRRMRCLMLDARAAVEIAPAAADRLAEALGRDSGWAADQVREFSELAALYLPRQGRHEEAKKG